jgi:hypothetical protein
VLALVVALVAGGRIAVRDQPGTAGSTQAAATSAAPSDVQGSTVALRPRTGLRLLVADAPAPFVLDLERGTEQSISGLPRRGPRGVGVLALGDHALVLSHRLCTRCRHVDAYVLRRGSTAASRLGVALQVVPSWEGQAVWTLARRSPGRCVIQELGLDGRPRAGGRAASCRTGLVAELPAGLLVTATGPLGRNAHSALLGPGRSVVRLRDPQPRPVVGNLVLLGLDRRSPLILQDARSGDTHRLPWPAGPGYSLGDVAGEPNGRRAIVEFARYSPEHRLDLWLLDTATRRWQRLPGMPARLVPKATDVEWTPDGRVVILSGDVLQVWRPGEPRVAVSRVKPPKKPGSEFVVW